MTYGDINISKTVTIYYLLATYILQNRYHKTFVTFGNGFYINVAIYILNLVTVFYKHYNIKQRFRQKPLLKGPIWQEFLKTVTT